MTDIRQYFLQGIEFLNGLEEFKDILLAGEIMRVEKKQSFFSTVHFTGYAKNHDKLLGHATIYANLRDLKTCTKVLEALDHEACHIVPRERGYYKALLLNHLGSGDNPLGLDLTE